MISLSNINSFDIVVAVVLVALTVRGVWIGFMKQLATFIALVGSFWLAGEYSGKMAPYVSSFVHDPKILFYLSFGILFFFSAILLVLVGKVLRRVMEISLLGWFDRLLGLVLGAVTGVLVASLIFMALSATLSAENTLLKNAASAPYLQRGASLVKSVINDPRVREFFTPKEPAIKPDQKGGAKKQPLAGTAGTQPKK